MSFFDTKNVGYAFIFVGVLLLIEAIGYIAAGFVDMDVALPEEITNKTPFFVITGVGAVLAALIYIGYALSVKNLTKIDTLAGYVRVVGVTFAVTGIFSAIAMVFGYKDIGSGLGAGAIALIITIVISFILVFIAGKINDGKQTTGDKIIWVILLIAFILMVIAYIPFGTTDILSIINCVVHIIIAVFMIAYLFDPEVRQQMNM
ncbi:MAG: hypothetical protein IJT54_01235 [Candidatus Methanomethylophilaceae archaeon]|nr:hypothetical protein [Candidatus Methanomethylophilaceae archaeon]